MESSSTQESAVLFRLLRSIRQSKNISAKGNVKRGQLQLWCSSVRSHVKGIYGTEHEVTKSLSHKLITENINAREELEKRTHLLGLAGHPMFPLSSKKYLFKKQLVKYLDAYKAQVPCWGFSSSRKKGPADLSPIANPGSNRY